MKAKIGFKKFEINCIIGELSYERIQKQSIWVDLEVEYDIAKVCQSDHIDDAVDYVALSKTCEEVALEGNFHLVETLLYHIVKNIFKKYPIFWCCLTIEKPGGFSGETSAFLSLECSKEEFYALDVSNRRS